MPLSPITETSEFTSSVQSPANGDSADVEVLKNAALQPLVNRTKYLKDQIDNGIRKIRYFGSQSLLQASTDHEDGEIVLVGDNGIYRYNAASTAPVDAAYNVVKPTDVAGSGRWVRGAAQMRSVADLTALASLVPISSDRDIVQVIDGRGIYFHSSTSVATADGFWVLNASGGGRWLRQDSDLTTGTGSSRRLDQSKAAVPNRLVTVTGNYIASLTFNPSNDAPSGVSGTFGTSLSVAVLSGDFIKVSVHLQKVYDFGADLIITVVDGGTALGAQRYLRKYSSDYSSIVFSASGFVPSNGTMGIRLHGQCSNGDTVTVEGYNLEVLVFRP